MDAREAVLLTLLLSGRQGAWGGAAGSLGWRSRGLMMACPLEGIVRRLNKDFEQRYKSKASSCLAFCSD